MTSALEFARVNGYAQLLRRVSQGAYRRGRDRWTARHLRAPGFRAGGAPRLLGLSHMHIAPDFNAGDGLWLEAVLSYGEGAARQQFSPQLRIGGSARLSDQVHIACLREVTIGDHLLCGSRVLISDHAHGCYDASSASDPTAMPASDPSTPPARRPLYSAAPVRIGDNVWLGDGVAVLAGADIGAGCVIGANSVVTGPIPAGRVAVGAPAQVVRRWDPAARRWLPVS